MSDSRIDLNTSPQREHRTATAPISPVTPSKLLARVLEETGFESRPRAAKKATPSTPNGSPFTGTHARIYERAAADIKKKSPNCEKKFSANIISPKSEKLTSDVETKTHYEFIQTKLSQLLAIEEIKNAISTANNNKNEYYKTQNTLDIKILDIIIEYLKKNKLEDAKKACSELQDIIAKKEILTNLHLELQNEKYSDKSDSDNYDYFIDDLNEHIARIKNKKILTTDSLCLSFTATSTKPNTPYQYYISISSPENNKQVIETLTTILNSNSDFSHFLISETVSADFNQLMQITTNAFSKQKPRTPGRPCAEKSALSTLVKLPSDITVHGIFSFAVTKDGFNLIPPCDNCNAHMDTSDLILQIKPPVSPIKNAKPLETTETIEPHNNNANRPLFT
jgi:hypothetical protein